MAWNITTSKQTEPDLEILVHQVNVDVAASIVIDASTVAPDANGDRILKAGTPMTKNANNQYQEWDGTGADLNVQRIVISGTGGQYVLIHSGNSAAALDWDATAAELETALEATADLVDVEVSGVGSTGDPFVVTIVDGEVSAITATDTLTGGAGTVTITNAGTAVILGILSRTEVFPDGTSKSDLPSAMWNFGQWFRADRIKGWASNQAAIKAALPMCKFS